MGSSVVYTHTGSKTSTAAVIYAENSQCMTRSPVHRSRGTIKRFGRGHVVIAGHRGILSLELVVGTSGLGTNDNPNGRPLRGEIRLGGKPGNGTGFPVLSKLGEQSQKIIPSHQCIIRGLEIRWIGIHVAPSRVTMPRHGCHPK